MQRVSTFLLRQIGFAYLVINGIMGAVMGLAFAAGGVWLLSLVFDMSTGQFLRLLAVMGGLTVGWIVWTMVRENWMIKPIRRWFAGERSDADTVAAWHCAVALPYYVFRDIAKSILTIAAPWTIYAWIELELSLLEAGGLLLIACLMVGYVAVLRAFMMEIFLRPVVVEIARTMPRELRAAPPVLSLRWKLLAALPFINVITGFVVAALASERGDSALKWLSVNVLIAVGVAFVITLVLTMAMSRTIMAPLQNLLRGVERLKRGDLDVTVPITTNDEVGQLTRSFNDMVAGLAERERLREAFGSYVAPEVAKRVLEEGAMLEGEELDATTLFLDIRNFTSLVEKLGARQTVGLINRMFERAVPILDRRGGHVAAFVGDGLMALFGAPARHHDHADRALAAAREIVAVVQRDMGGELSVGIGINSGRVLVGSVGGGGRLEFTAIGDTVNVASRVERATRDTGDPILITAATRDLLRNPDGLEPRPPASLKGKEKPVALYAPVVGEQVPPGR